MRLNVFSRNNKLKQLNFCELYISIEKCILYKFISFNWDISRTDKVSMKSQCHAHWQLSTGLLVTCNGKTPSKSSPYTHRKVLQTFFFSEIKPFPYPIQIVSGSTSGTKIVTFQVNLHLLPKKKVCRPSYNFKWSGS